MFCRSHHHLSCQPVSLGVRIRSEKLNDPDQYPWLNDDSRPLRRIRDGEAGHSAGTQLSEVIIIGQALYRIYNTRDNHIEAVCQGPQQIAIGQRGDQMRRLSKRASHVLKLAHEAAREYGQGYVGTEHMLLGIIREGTSMAARTLLDHGATEYRAKAMVDELVDKRLGDTWVTGRLPGSPHFMDVFTRAERIAQRLGHSHICTEHLLAALLTQTGSMGLEVLRAMGITMVIVDHALHELVPVGCS
jgi:hypothetical protein